jgi:hypothetical protein
LASSLAKALVIALRLHYMQEAPAGRETYILCLFAAERFMFTPIPLPCQELASQKGPEIEGIRKKKFMKGNSIVASPPWWSAVLAASLSPRGSITDTVAGKVKRYRSRWAPAWHCWGGGQSWCLG